MNAVGSFLCVLKVIFCRMFSSGEKPRSHFTVACNIRIRKRDQVTLFNDIAHNDRIQPCASAKIYGKAASDLHNSCECYLSIPKVVNRRERIAGSHWHTNGFIFLLTTTTTKIQLLKHRQIYFFHFRLFFSILLLFLLQFLSLSLSLPLFFFSSDVRIFTCR